MQTKNGVVYDLRNSPFRATYLVYDFYFSSGTHMAKFVEKLVTRTEWLTDSLSRRFHFNVQADLIAVLQLYCQVETRGFLIHDIAEDKWLDCRENITLNGLRISARN